MARTDKSAAIAELKKKFEDSDTMPFTEYRGLTVMQLKTLRRTIGANVQFKVAKNTLAEIAAKEAGIEGLNGLLIGPTAFAFVTGRIADTARAIRDFAKDNPALLVKGGVFEDNLLSGDDIEKLADLKSREMLLSRAAGMLKVALLQAAYVSQAPVPRTVRTVGTLRVKEEAAV